MSANSSKPLSRGYTIVELLVVVMVLGILSAVVIPRLNPTDYRSTQFRDQVVSALRYAQKTATSHRRMVCVSFPSNSQLTLSIADINGASACNTALLLPGTQSNTLNSPDPANVVFTTSSSPAIPLPSQAIFQPDGTSTDQSMLIAGETPIIIVGATGYVQ